MNATKSKRSHDKKKSDRKRKCFENVNTTKEKERKEKRAVGGILLEGMYDVYSEQSDSRSASTSQEGAGRGGERNSLI